MGVKVQHTVAYHPRFAAEVINGEEGVDAGDAAEVKADHKVPEVLARDHAVGVLADQDKVWLERPAKTDQGGNVGLCVQRN